MAEKVLVDLKLARDEDGFPCGACVDDRSWRRCRCVADCGSRQCTGADLAERED